ncbi:MAG TPA: AraC family transcriptional regulator, partial [Ktedonobacterales bacterium]|nr:AraC family transcriptional regulator [Ktedonobacterales bacterium]
GVRRALGARIGATPENSGGSEESGDAVIDPLTEVLRDLRLASSFFAHSDMQAPWGLAFQATDGPAFHAIISGHCRMRLGSGEPVELEQGDLILLPHGEDHEIADPADSPATPLAALSSTRVGNNVALCRICGSGARSVLICGRVDFAGPIANPLVEQLPRQMLLRRRDLAGAHEWLDATLGMLSAEAATLRPGAAAIMTRLTEMLVLQTVRAWLERDRNPNSNSNRERGWLAALSDPQVGQALALMHRRAEERWTVATLAQAIHLSRSVFSERFTNLVGLSPMQYLTCWRMQLASNWLREERRTPGEIAYRLGYSSEAAFSRAFKRYQHVAPGAIRRGSFPVLARSSE